MVSTIATHTHTQPAVAQEYHPTECRQQTLTRRTSPADQLQAPGPSSPGPSSLLIRQSPSAIDPPQPLHPQQRPHSPSSPSPTALIPLDPFLTSLDHRLITPGHPDPVHPSSIPPPASSLKPPISTVSTPTSIPRLPKAKLLQCNQLNHAAQCALKAVWDTLSAANASNPPQLEISRNLDCLFGELHASAIPFKQDALALIWPQSIANKSVKASFNTRRSPAYFSIRRANIALVAEYMLYAMPGEEAYGKNDIVFACEGFLPLVLDPELVLEPRSWKLFNELKIQIYIQRLDQSGADEANSRVLPNLFVESLASYSGLQVPEDLEKEFEKLANETQEEIIQARANLEALRTAHPYIKFATWALEFLHECANRVDREEQDCNQLESSGIPVLNLQLAPETNHSNKKKRKRKPEDAVTPLPPLHPQLQSGSSNQQLDGINVDASNSVDINVEQPEEEECGLDGELGSKGRYNPYRLGRGKGPASAPRRRWTQEEYDLLLDEVRLHSTKYDCMAQIIKRHGRNGEISEIFKDQNNVSLKDKARNLTMEWQRHGYPEDKPWLKEAFARFSVKNFKRSSNSKSGENREDEYQANIEIGDDRRHSGSNEDNEGNIELGSDGNLYLNHVQCSQGSGSRVSAGMLAGEIRVQPDGNIPVIAKYQDQMVVEDEQVMNDEELNPVSPAGPVGQPDALGQRNDDHHGGDVNEENEMIRRDTHEESNDTFLEQLCSHSNQAPALPNEFEIHPHLMMSSNEIHHQPNQPSKNAIDPSFTSPADVALHSGLLVDQRQPDLDVNHLDGSNCPVEQLLDPNLLS